MKNAAATRITTVSATLTTSLIGRIATPTRTSTSGHSFQILYQLKWINPRFFNMNNTPIRTSTSPQIIFFAFINYNFFVPEKLL
jgi:hypothetical protein